MKLFKNFMKSSQSPIYISGTLIFILLVGVIYNGLLKVESQVRQQTVDNLRSILNASHDTLGRIWLKNIYIDAREILSNQTIRKHVKDLLRDEKEGLGLHKHPAQRYLKEYLKNNYEHLNGIGYEVISPGYIRLSANNERNVGTKSIIAKYYPLKLARVFAGMPQFVPPVHENHDSSEAHDVNREFDSAMFYLVPMRDANSNVIAALAVQLNPYQTIGSIAWSGRIGDTGETYLFDKDAWLITESRFKKQLVSTGVLKPGNSSIHAVDLYVPEPGNKGHEHSENAKLTFMAERAIAHESGESTEGYTNYLGVRVLGVWLWDEHLGIGMATEIQEKEAMAPYRRTRTVVLTMKAFIFISMMLFFYILRVQREKNRAEIEKSEAYLRVVLENAADGIITIDEKGIIQTFNLEAEKLFQYKTDEVLGNNVSMIVPDAHKDKHDEYLKRYSETGEKKLIDNKTNLYGVKKDGITFPISVSLREIKLPDNIIFVAIVRDLTDEYATRDKLQKYQNELETLVDERTSALMESESLNRQILESAGEGIYGLNTEGETIFVNPAAANMLGYKIEELIGQSMHSLVHHSHSDGSYYPREDCPMYSAFTHGKNHHVSNEVFWCKDGRSFPVEYTSKPIYSANKVVGAVVTFSDISERLSIEEKLRDVNADLEKSVNARTLELRQSQNVLKRAQQIAHLGSWTWDIESGNLDWSDEIFRIFGLRPQQFEPTYNAFVEIIHPDDRGSVTNAVNESITNPDIHYNMDHKIVLPDGELKYVHEQGEVEWDENGNAVRMIGIVHDITKQKKSQNIITETMKELAKNERVLRLALSGAGAGYWQLDIEKSELYWDEQSMGIFGVSKEEFNGDFGDWLNILYKEDLKSTAKEFNAALEDKEVDVLYQDYRIIKATGDIRYIHVTGNIERDDSDKAVRVYGLYFDVTDSKHAEQELVNALDAAELANRAKSEFLAVMSHEIRTPMNAIIGMSNLVMNTELTVRQENYIKKVVSSAESLLHIINDILDFSKIEAGKLHIENVDFKLDEVFEKLSHLVALKAQEKGLEFLFSIQPEIPAYLNGDPTRLLQILVNLTSNAVKFTDMGEVVLSVEVEKSEAEQLHLNFTVRDTGVGIDKEQQKRLFQSFTQADASITRKYGGTGLGLVIVKRLVKLMGGTIRFESVPGIGTSFYISVPFGISYVPTRVDRALPSDVENLYVLVVDDSESARTILGETLEGFGFKVDLAATVNEAISATETAEQRGNPYQLVLMDWKMPGQSGVEGARSILGKSKSIKLPVVMMVTAYNAEELAEEIDNIAISSTLVKPVSPSSLLDAILNAFSQQKLDAKEDGASEEISNPEKLLKGVRILVVEDNELNMELTVELLREVGVKTDSASNGKEAITMIEKNHYDCVLMDVHMPVMGGIEATEMIRKKPKYNDLPIVALTADAMDSDRQELILSGMNDVIVKPINVGVMLSTIAEVMHGKNRALSYEDKMIKNNNINKIKLSIHGLDANAGLATCNGKLSLYQKLLKKFINEVEFIEGFKMAIKKGDMELAERLAHTLKGSSGNIGAFVVQEAAKKLQDAVKGKAGKRKVNSLFKELESVLIELIQEIAKVDIEANEKGENGAGTVEVASLIPEFEKLTSLLEEDDTDATEMIENIFDELKNSKYGDEISEIARFVSRYEFEEALQRVTVLTEKIKAA